MMSNQILVITEVCYFSNTASFNCHVRLRHQIQELLYILSVNCIILTRCICLVCLFFDLFPSLCVTYDVLQNPHVGIQWREREWGEGRVDIKLWVQCVYVCIYICVFMYIWLKLYMYRYLKVHENYTSWRIWATTFLQFGSSIDELNMVWDCMLWLKAWIVSQVVITSVLSLVKKNVLVSCV